MPRASHQSSTTLDVTSLSHGALECQTPNVSAFHIAIYQASQSLPSISSMLHRQMEALLRSQGRVTFVSLLMVYFPQESSTIACHTLSHLHSVTQRMSQFPRISAHTFYLLQLSLKCFTPSLLSLLLLLDTRVIYHY